MFLLESKASFNKDQKNFTTPRKQNRYYQQYPNSKETLIWNK